MTKVFRNSAQPCFLPIVHRIIKKKLEVVAKRKGTFRACCHAVHHRGQSGTAMSGGEMAVFPVSGRESIKEALPHPTGAHIHSRACCLLVPEDPGSNRGPDTDSQPAHLALTQFGCWWCPPRRTALFLSSVREEAD